MISPLDKCKVATSMNIYMTLRLIIIILLFQGWYLYLERSFDINVDSCHLGGHGTIEMVQI